MKLLCVRQDLSRGARIVGDVQALKKGPTAIVKRMERRWLWRIVGRL